MRKMLGVLLQTHAINFKDIISTIVIELDLEIFIKFITNCSVKHNGLFVITLFHDCDFFFEDKDKYFTYFVFPFP